MGKRKLFSLSHTNRCYAHLTFDRSISNPGYTIGILYHQKCPQLRLAYLPSTGAIINEPPLGFYTAALFFKVFGFTVENGTNMITLFGLGCAFMVYKLGRELYGKATGLFAAAFFALAPWELVLSRAFLIDTQCLFLSLVCLVTLLSILGINMYLGVGINLKAPYTSAIKFSYQSLPFFSLAAASLASKCVLLLNWAKHTVKLKNALTGVVGFVGVFLLVTPLLINMNSAHQLSMTSFLIFKVQAGQSVGYSFDVFSPITQGSPLMTVQYLGFAFILSGLLWTGKRFVLALFRPMRRSIQAKKALNQTR